MSASAQEVKSQIAEMREALRSTRASARLGRIVGILGVVVGLCVVAMYVLAFVNLFTDLKESPELQREAKKRFEQLELDVVLPQVFQDVAPAYIKESRALLEDLDLLTVLSEQAKLMLEDLQPVLRSELARVQPQLQQILEAQREKTLSDLTALLQGKVGNRLAAMVGRQGERIGHETGMDEQTLQNIVMGLQEASVEAFRGMLDKRKGNLEKELEEMDALAAEIPPLPGQSQEQVLNELGKVLIALLKHNLPDHQVEDLQLRPAQPLVPATGPPPEVRERIEELQSGPGGPSAAVEEMIEEAKEAAQEGVK